MHQTTDKLKNERGQTMVELAMCLPLIVVLLFGIVQFGIAFNNYVTLTDAVRAGARKAAVSRNLSDPAKACRDEVIAARDTLTQTDANGRLELEKNLYCNSSWTPGSDVTVHADYPYDINLLGWNVYSGRLNSTMVERVE